MEHLICRTVLCFDVFVSRESAADEYQLCSFNWSYFKNDAKNKSRQQQQQLFVLFLFLLRTIPGESERQVTAITVSADKEAADTFHMQEIKKKKKKNLG